MESYKLSSRNVLNKFLNQKNVERIFALGSSLLKMY